MNLWETFQKLNRLYGAKERLEEGKKINIPDYNQEHDIDSYVVEVTTHPDLGWLSNEQCYFKKGWDEWASRNYIDCVTENLEEAERFESIEDARKAIDDILNNEDFIFNQKNELYLRVAFDTDKYDYTMNDEDWNWTDYRIKPLYIRKTMYLELGD